VLSAFLDALEHSAEHRKHRLSHLIGNLASRIVDILIVAEEFPAPKTPQPKDASPAIINKKNHTIDGPGLDSHHIQVKFPKILVSIDLHALFADHLVPYVIVLIVPDSFVGWE
jgi:hypothetical protein